MTHVTYTGKLQEKVNNILKDCPGYLVGDNKILNFRLPSFRLCPNCGLLVEIILNQCKHCEKCENCGVAFCFSCLSIKNGTWICGSEWEKCPTSTAPRQHLN